MICWAVRVHAKGSGLLLQCLTHQSMRSLSSATDEKLVLVRALRVSTLNQASTRLSHEELVSHNLDRCSRAGVILERASVLVDLAGHNLDRCSRAGVTPETQWARVVPASRFPKFPYSKTSLA